MSIRWVNGIAACDIRRQGVPRLSISLKTRVRSEADRRHGALMVLYSVNTPETLALIEQLRSGDVSIERVTQMVDRREALVPVPTTTQTLDQWGTVSQNIARYIRWMEDHPKRETQTAKLAAHQLARFEAFIYDGRPIGELPLADVPSAAILAYQRSMVEGGRTVNVITTFMSRVGSLWRFVQQQEATEAREAKRPARELYSPVDPTMLIRDTTRRERFLSEKELERLFRATPDPLLFPIAAGVMAGLRIEEVLHLRPVLDVDLTLGTITVQKRDGWKPKTKRSNRTVPMTDTLRSIAERHTTAFASEAWMLPSLVTSQPLGGHGIRQHFRAVVERAGMAYGLKAQNGVVFHTLRHTFASHLAMRGVDLYTIAQLLGDSLQTTEGVYAKLSPDFKRAAIAKLGPVFTLPAEVTQSFTQKASENAD